MLESVVCCFDSPSTGASRCSTDDDNNNNSNIVIDPSKDRTQSGLVVHRDRSEEDHSTVVSNRREGHVEKSCASNIEKLSVVVGVTGKQLLSSTIHEGKEDEDEEVRRTVD